MKIQPVHVPGVDPKDATAPPMKFGQVPESAQNRDIGAFDDRYVCVFVRDSGFLAEYSTKRFSIGFVFFDIAIRHFYVGSFNSALSQSYKVKA